MTVRLASFQRVVGFVASVAICLQIISTAETQTFTRDNCSKVGNDATKIVCICNEQKCDDLAFEWPSAPGEVHLVETTRAGHRFSAKQLANATAGQSTASSRATINVDLDKQHQKVLGWGGAFTDAAAINIQSVSSSLKERILESYFGRSGLQYNFGRVPIGGSDFSPRAYSYDDSPEPDLNLTKWALTDEDLSFKIPTIKRAMEVAKSVNGTELKLFASPWSPPKWMKTSNSFKRGHLINKHEIYQSYANYLVKFYQSYRDHGIEFWGATVQNEPMSAYLVFYFFNSLQMSSSETVKFVGEYLGPALESFGYTKENFKLMIGDDSLGFVNYQVPNIMEDKRVQKYISGFAFHWYLSGFLAPYNSLTNLVNKIQDKIEFVMMSEACLGAFMSFKHVDLGDWQRAEAYASDIIEDFRRKTGAWIDWNLALDLKGGPNWSGNFVDSPIIVDKEKNEFIKQPMYYALAHFTRFMRPGSVIVDSSASGTRGISVLAAHSTETGHLIVNVLNKSHDRKQISLDISRSAQKLYTANAIELEPRSVSTIITKL